MVAPDDDPDSERPPADRTEIGEGDASRSDDRRLRAHLEDIHGGCGCVELWEELTEYRAEKSEE